MTTRLTVAEVRDSLQAVLNRVARGEQAEIVDADDEALAVVISVEAFRQFQQAANRDFSKSSPRSTSAIVMLTQMR